MSELCLRASLRALSAGVGGVVLLRVCCRGGLTFVAVLISPLDLDFGRRSFLVIGLLCLRLLDYHALGSVPVGIDYVLAASAPSIHDDHDHSFQHPHNLCDTQRA